MEHQAEGHLARKREKTRRALIEAAARLFEERGYEQTTLADIAAAADIAPRTYFSYFDAKEGVFFAQLDARIAALSELELRREGEDLPAGLRRAAHEFVRALEPGPDPRLAADSMRRIIGGNPALQAAASLRLHTADRALAFRLAASYPDRLDDVLAAAIASAVTSGLRAAAEAEPSIDPGQAIDRVLDLLEQGLNGRSQE